MGTVQELVKFLQLISNRWYPKISTLCGNISKKLCRLNAAKTHTHGKSSKRLTNCTRTTGSVLDVNSSSTRAHSFSWRVFAYCTVQRAERRDLMQLWLTWHDETADVGDKQKGPVKSEVANWTKTKLMSSLFSRMFLSPLLCSNSQMTEWILGKSSHAFLFVCFL